MHFTLCGKRWIKGERFLGGFISVLVFLLRRGNHQFSPPVLGASSGSTHGKQKEYCHYICLLSAAYSNTDLGECLWWGVLSQVEDWIHGDRTPKPSSIPLLCAGIDSLPHLAVPCRSEVSSLAHCVVKAGFQLRPCCWAAKDHLVLCLLHPALGLLHLVWCSGKAWAAAIPPLLGSRRERNTFLWWSKCWWGARNVSHFLQCRRHGICRWAS